MRILVVTQYFWPEVFRINDLVSGLTARGHEVTVLTGLPNYPEGRFARGYGWSGPYSETYDRARVVRSPLVPRGSTPVSLALNYVSFALSACLVGAVRCRGRFDAVFVYEPSPITVGIPARFIGWLKKAPILFWVQDLWPESLSATGAVKSKFVLDAVERLVRWIYRGCTRVLVQSEAFVGPIKRLGVPDERIAYFPNSAEALYHPVVRQADWTGPPLPDGFRVMFAGNLGAAQSFETILGAAERLRGEPRIHWLVLGDGRQAGWIRQEVQRRGLEGQVHLLGRHALETMPDWFAQADVMLVSLRRDAMMARTIPAKVQSYMACAKPIVAALDGEGARVVNVSGAGRTAPSEDADALAAAVMGIYRMPEQERQAMGDRGLRYFRQNFDRDRLLDQLESWLQSAARRAR